MTDSLAAYCVDGAVLWFGVTIENALHETQKVQVGKSTEYRPLYRLEELLRDDFKLPRPPTKLEKRRQGALNLLALAGDPRSNVKLWRELPKGEAPEKVA